MQTWEYAPKFALRTYAYLFPMAAVAKCFQYLLGCLPPAFVHQLSTLLLLAPQAATKMDGVLIAPQDNKPLLFAMLRSFLALISCYSELSFLDAIHEVVGPTVARWAAICSLTAAGNFHSSQAFLPSSSVMILWRLSASNQLKENYGFAIFWGLVAVLAVGWPFCAVLFISTGLLAIWKASGLDFVSRRNWRNNFQFSSVMMILLRTILHSIAIQAFVMAVDYHFYGRIVSPTWNIFVYNAQSGGDELYGVEPLSYYIKNLLLNFNFVALLGVLSLPIIMVKKLVERFFSVAFDNDHKMCNSVEVLVLAPMYVWMAIVFSRPHKEERFLFPIYPMLCFGAAITMREVICLASKLLSLLLRSKQRKQKSRGNIQLLLGLTLLFPSIAISVSRSFALYHYYSAPLRIYRDLFSHASASLVLSGEKQINYVCTAGEWYRFPSSFFLPPNHQLGFLKSSFTGQLPQPFSKYGSKPESLAVQAGNFNDVNEEEMDRYVDIKQCSYVIELVPSESKNFQNVPECLQYMQSESSDGGFWTELASYKYLDPESTSTLHRILYLPFGRDGKVIYKGYNLYSKGS